MVVLGRDKHERIELCDLRGPGFRVRLCILAHRGRKRLIEKGQVERRDVYDFERGIAPLRSDAVDPACDILGLATGTGASDDNRHIQHVSSPLTSRPKLRNLPPSSSFRPPAS